MSKLSFLESLLSRYEEIIVVANTNFSYSKVPNNTCSRGDILFIVFNQIDINTIPDDVDILWVHRLDEGSGKYFGEEFVGVGNIMHLCVQNYNASLKVPAWSVGLISSIEDTPYIESYPLSKRVIGVKKKYIVSPTTGFVVLSILNYLKDNSMIKSSVKAIGFGRLTGGSQQHHWRYERQFLLAFTHIEFLGFNMRGNKFAIAMGSIVPNFVVQLFYDVARK